MLSNDIDCNKNYCETNIEYSKIIENIFYLFDRKNNVSK